jgi:purine catabolism regulator
MGVTIRAILDLEVMRRGGARVVAGRDGLDRNVRWVHVTELPDIAHLLRGGELLLTTGMAISDQDEMQRCYVSELAGAGVSGVVIELGRNFESVPAALVRAAQKHKLPIIALERETRFVEITEIVHREIINHQYKVFSRAERVSHDLTALILNGAEAAQIVSRLAEIFDNHVVLEDAAHQVIEVAGPASKTGALLSAWEDHSRPNHDASKSGTVHHHTGDRECMWVELWLRHNLWGRLHVIATNSQFEEDTELLVDRAGAAIALSLLSEKDAAHMADRARGALVGEVVAGRQGSGAEFLQRAKSLGVDFGGGPLVAVALETVGTLESIDGHELTEEDRLCNRLRIADELRTSAREHECAALVALSGDRVIAVMADMRNRSLVPFIEHAIDSAIERMALHDAAVTVFAGTSSEVTADALHRGIEEATTALTYGRRSGTGRGVHHFSDLGTYQLLMSLAQGPELARFVEYELQALLDHDAHARGKLLPTLRAYLLHSGRKSETARDLGIQRRTLYARVEKIEAILLRDLESQDTRTRLTLALQGLELLQDRWNRNIASRQMMSNNGLPF